MTAVASDYLIFADETGTHDGCPCYGIGCFCVPASSFEHTCDTLDEIVARYRVTQELKWTRIGEFNATFNAAFECVEYLLRNRVTFNAMVVLKRVFRHWNEDEERAFWVSYHILLRHVSRQTSGQYEVFIDDRSDSYARRDEVLELTTNYYLRRGHPDLHAVRVRRADSRKHLLLQCADILTGAITAATNRSREERFRMNDGKLRLCARFAELLGLDGLHCDTMPNGVLNIWHFPIEFRGPTGRPALRPVSP